MTEKYNKGYGALNYFEEFFVLFLMSENMFQFLLLLH